MLFVAGAVIMLVGIIFGVAISDASKRLERTENNS